MAYKPHFCVFIGKYVLGSVHDFKIMKRSYHRYLDYLLKLPDGNSSLPGHQLSCFWGVLVDKGYVGPENTMPDLRWFTPIKDPRNPTEEHYNQLVGRQWIPVECFFGRLMTTSGVLNGVYCWSHTHFDDDFTIGYCLVDERLSHASLNDDDQKTY